MIRYEGGVLVGEFDYPTDTFEEWLASEIKRARNLGQHARVAHLNDARYAHKIRQEGYVYVPD